MSEKEMNEKAEDGGLRRLTIGSAVITGLGLFFGAFVIMSGSFLTWRSDRVLGLYNQSGWRFNNIVSGDGKLTLVLGAIIAAGLILGFLFKNRVAYAIALAADLAVMALAVYELVYLLTRHGVVSPGNGLYMALGGSVAGFLCSLGGYLMMAEEKVELDEAPADGQPETA